MNLTNVNWFRFTCKLRSTMFSPHHSYACYLVCKLEDIHLLPDDNLVFGGEYDLDGIHAGYISSSILDTVFYPMNIPTINPNHGSQGASNIPTTTERSSGEQGEDGWKRVLMCKPRRLQDRKLLSLKLTRSGFSGISVAGIEFRPCI